MLQQSRVSHDARWSSIMQSTALIDSGAISKKATSKYVQLRPAYCVYMIKYIYIFLVKQNKIFSARYRRRSEGPESGGRSRQTDRQTVQRQERQRDRQRFARRKWWRRSHAERRRREPAEVQETARPALQAVNQNASIFRALNRAAIAASGDAPNDARHTKQIRINSR